MDLTVIDETGARTRQVTVPDAVASGRIAAHLIQLLGLPGTGPDDEPLSYGFYHDRTGKQIDENETLAQADVREHDILRLVVVAPANAPGAAPPQAGTQPPRPPRSPSTAPAPRHQAETAVLSPPPPPPSQHAAPRGGRWSSPIAIAIVVLAIALVGAAVAIVVGRGSGGNAHSVAHYIVTDTTISAAPTTEGESTTTGETGETGESTTTSGGTLPAESNQQMESEIQQLLRSWHEDVVHGDYRAAWDLLSQRKQSQEDTEQGYATWAKNQSTLRPYLNPAGLQVSIQKTESSSGVAQVDVTGMTWDKPGAPCSEWSGITWVKYEDGEWRYDPGYSTTPQREREWKPHFSELLGGSC